MVSLHTNQPIADIISSLEYIYRLKSISRRGWVQSGIPHSEVESVAAHSYGMSILILFLSSELQQRGIDIQRSLNMALIHDMAEALVGDITPQDDISDGDKLAAEAVAMQELFTGVKQGEFFRELWNEFEAGKSPEAQVVKRLDKLDMLIQAYLYEKQFELRLDSFWEQLDDLFKDSESESIYNHIRSNRFEIKGS